jgi:diphthamide synthase subunit DPH2
MVLNFEEEYLVKELKRLRPKKILVQLPEGIKTKALELEELFNKLKIEAIFSSLVFLENR